MNPMDKNMDKGLSKSLIKSQLIISKDNGTIHITS